jgi:hypothetical protein
VLSFSVIPQMLVDGVNRSLFVAAMCRALEERWVGVLSWGRRMKTLGTMEDGSSRLWLRRREPLETGQPSNRLLDHVRDKQANPHACRSPRGLKESSN